DRYRLARYSGERDDEVGRCDGFGAAGTRQAEGDRGRIVVVGDGTGARPGGDRCVDGVGEVDREGFVNFVRVVAIDNDRDRLRRGRIGREGNHTALGDIIWGSR